MKRKLVEVNCVTLNVSTMTKKGRGIADMIKRKIMDILCKQKTKWKETKET